MTPESYERLSDLFARGSGLSAGEQQALLDEASQSDPDLRAELERLFQLDDHRGLAAPDETRESTKNTEPSRGPCPEVAGYRIHRLLGEGGMGQVWRATQLCTQREVALKLIHGIRFTSSQNRARFEREIELTARLNHPHIANVFDSGFADGYAYYAMELVDGQPLDDYIRGQVPDELSRLRLMHTVCRAVQHAHQRGVIHRDLKPSNVLVTKEGQPVVVDFGLAKSVASESENPSASDSPLQRPLTCGFLIGTPEYMSPEQAAGGIQQVDTRSDVFSLGVMLYWMLTNRLPHDGEGDRLSIVRRLASGNLVSPRQASTHLDRGLAAILDKALAHEPNDRYDGAGELADDLQRHLEGEPVLAASAGWWYVVRRRLRKHSRSVAVVALLLTLAISCVGAFVAMTNRHARIAVNLAQRAERSNQEARLAERDALRMAYIHQLALANNEVLAFQHSRARSLLDSCSFDHRGWEWHYLRNRAATRDRSYARVGPFEHPVRNLAFSKDGKRLAIATNISTTQKTPDAAITICDALSGSVLTTLKHHTDGITAISFTPDGRQLLSGSRDRTLRRWNVETGELLETVNGPRSNDDATPLMAFAIRFSDKGSWVAMAGHPQGLFLAKVPEEVTWRGILDAAKQIVRCAGEDDAIAFTPDGQQLAWSTRIWQGNMGHLYVIDCDRAEVVAHETRPQGESLYHIDYDLEGRRLVTGDLRQSATVYSNDLSQVLGKFRSQEGAVRRVFFTADGSGVLGLVGNGRLARWNHWTHQIEEIWQAAEEFPSWEMALSSDREKVAIAAGTPTVVRLWDLREISSDREILATHAPKARDLAISPDGAWVATCGDDGRVELWSWPDRRLHRTLDNAYPQATAVDISPNNRWLAVGWSQHPHVAPVAPYGRIDVIDLHSGEPAREPIEVTGWVWDLRFDKSGEMLIVADGVMPEQQPRLTGGAHLIRWATGQRICSVKLPDTRCRSAALSSDGRMLVTSSQDTLAVWSVPSGKLLAKNQGTAGRNFVKMLPGTSQILTSGAAAIEIRQLPSLKLVRTFKHQRDIQSPTNLIGDAVVHPQGHCLVSGSWNGTITIWDMESGQPLLTLPAHETGVHRLQFTPDGNSLLTAGHDGHVRIWDGTPEVLSPPSAK